MFELFNAEFKENIAHYRLIHQGVYTEAEIATLPVTAQRYCIVCGQIGKQKMTTAH